MLNSLRSLLKLEFLHETDYVQRKTALVRLVLLALVCLTSVVGLQLSLTLWIEKAAYNGAPIWIIGGFWLGWIGLYARLRRLGYQRIGFVIIACLSLIGYWFSWQWGIDAPFGLAVYLLSVILAGLLFGSRAIIVTVICHSLVLICLSPLQVYGLISVDQSWKRESVQVGDGLGAATMLGVVTLVAWIFNREVEIVSGMAQNLNQTLAHERDNLEKLVLRRTTELRQAQQARLAQLYRLVELGRSSAELFHEFTNPLSIAVLQIEQLTQQPKLPHARQSLEELNQTIKQLELYVGAVRAQASGQKISTVFQPVTAVQQALTLMQPKAKRARVELEFTSRGQGTLLGEATKLSQVTTNLIANAIDAYSHPSLTQLSVTPTDRRVVITQLVEKNRGWSLTVRDFGQGISAQQRKYLFEPFFTTKSPDQGTGLGLPISREIIRQVFGGWIKVISHKNSASQNQGTTLMVWLPKN